jgi:hypothetical protein
VRERAQAIQVEQQRAEAARAAAPVDEESRKRARQLLDQMSSKWRRQSGGGESK